MSLPNGVYEIDTQLIEELSAIAAAVDQNAIESNPRQVHAVMLFFKGTENEPQLFVCKGHQLTELLPGQSYPPVENTTLKKADQAGVVVYTDAKGADPMWYYLNGRRMHSA